MSNNEDADVNTVLETVTRTLRSMVDLVDTAVASIKNHNNAINGLTEINTIYGDKIRTLETKVYAQEQDLAELSRSFDHHSHPHTHTYSQIHGDA